MRKKRKHNGNMILKKEASPASEHIDDSKQHPLEPAGHKIFIAMITCDKKLILISLEKIWHYKASYKMLQN